MKVVTFGEIMGRLCPPGYKKIVQTNSFDLTFAGGEANVAVSLANYGIDANFVTKLPDNDLGKSVLRILSSYGVGVDKIKIGGERLGMYYVEKGASQRPSKVIYDRKNSSIATSNIKDFNWQEILNNVGWFHFTGITPALSDTCVDITLEALKECKKRGITVSCDLNYRNKLWSTEKANKVMTELMEYVDICIGNEEDAEKVLGIKSTNSDVKTGSLDKKGYLEVAQKIASRFKCKTVAITLRESYSASVNGWSALLYKDNQAYFSKKYDITLVDRVGGGDSFVGALIYGLNKLEDNQEIVDFAVAASCLKHTIEGDFNQVSIADVKKLMNGDGSGRVQR